MRIVFQVIILMSLTCLIACRGSEESGLKEEAARPNIIFIMSDDHAEKAISAYNDQLVKTPNLDRLANEGMLFRNSFVTNSICAPSRAVILTGKYSHLNGLRDNRDAFDGSQQTLPKLLQAEGYKTGIVGKWHLKTEPTGFDYFNILIGQGPYYNPDMVSGDDTTHYVGYTTDVITDLALNFLKEQSDDEPFFLMYHHKAPHRNWMPNTKHLDLYANEDLPIPETLFDDYATRSDASREQDQSIKNMPLSHDLKIHPENYVIDTMGTGGGPASWDAEQAWKNIYGRLTQEQKEAWDAHYDKINEDFKNSDLSGDELIRWKYQRYIKDYLRCIVSVDENVGRVLDYLDSAGLADNTIVVYTSDQGFYLGEHGWYDKRFMYEESLSMPLMIRYPDKIKPGSVNEDMVLNLDFAPTFLDLAGAQVPDDLQGRSMRPLLEGEQPEDWRKAMFYHYYEYPHGWHSVKRHYGIRTDRYKLIHYYNDIDEWELYDLQADPNELNNIYEKEGFQSIGNDLKNELQRLMIEMKVDDLD